MCFSGLGIRGGQGPERIGEPEIGRDRLFLLTGAWPPVRIDPVALPGVRQFTQLGDGDRRAGSPGTEPAADVLFRPEEIHRASSDDDVVPPSNGWDEAMEPQAFIVRLLIAHLHRDRLTTVGARRVDATVDIERSADTERVPRTVRVPPSVIGEHPIGDRNRRERVSHPDLAGVRLQHQCMIIVQPLPGAFFCQTLPRTRSAQ